MKLENRKPVERINRIKSFFFEKINKIDQILLKLTKIKKKEDADNKSVMKLGALLKFYRD